MIKYVGFDKDGTLINGFDDYTKVWGKIIQSDFGINAKDAEDVFVKMAGEPTDIQLAAVLQGHNKNLSQSETFQKAEEIAEVLGKRVQGAPFPEVLEVLGKLKEEGYFIFVSSGQKENIVKNDLERTGIIQFIDFLAGIRLDQPDYKKGEPHFRAAAHHFGVDFETFVKETVFVGDTLVDIDLPKKVGILSIARAGTLSKEALLTDGAKVVVEDFSTLPQILKTL
jgi:phosphoglycolate phosphatase-like HAD superfamily hydrolase